MLAAVDWTSVLDTAITSVAAIIAAAYARSVHKQIKTPSGKSAGEVLEYAHDTAIANNMLLRQHNGPTKDLSKEQVEHEAETPPQVPVEQ